MFILQAGAGELLLNGLQKEIEIGLTFFTEIVNMINS
jgi:hypothetical protein